MLSLPLSLKEDGGRGGRGVEQGEEGGVWRSMNEKLRKTGLDKADELEVYLNCS